MRYQDGRWKARTTGDQNCPHRLIPSIYALYKLWQEQEGKDQKSASFQLPWYCSADLAMGHEIPGNTTIQACHWSCIQNPNIYSEAARARPLPENTILLSPHRRTSMLSFSKINCVEIAKWYINRSSGGLRPSGHSIFSTEGELSMIIPALVIV